MTKKLEYWYQFNWNEEAKECFVVFHASKKSDTNWKESKSFSDIADAPRVDEKTTMPKEEIVKNLMQYTLDSDLFVVYESLGGRLKCQIGQFCDGRIKTTLGSFGGGSLIPNYDGTVSNDKYNQFHWFITAEEALEYMEQATKQRMNDWKRLVNTQYEQERTVELITAKLKKRNKSRKVYADL